MASLLNVGLFSVTCFWCPPRLFGKRAEYGTALCSLAWLRGSGRPQRPTVFRRRGSLHLPAHPPSSLTATESGWGGVAAGPGGRAPPATEPVSTLCLPWSGFRIQELDILGPEFSGSPLKYNYTPVLDNFTTPLCLTTRRMRSGVGRAQNSPAST